MAILRHYKMVAAPGKGGALSIELRALATKVKALAGCEDVRMFVDLEQDEVIIFIEYWRSREDHKAAGPRLGKEALTAVMELLSDPPESRYLKVLD